MSKRRKTFIAAAAIAVVAGGGAAIAGATGGGDDDATEKPITGAALEQAKAAALAHTGGGRVTDTEAGDEESLYEVEVTRDDGSQVDVQLDERFQVVGTEDEGKGEENDDGAGDD